MEEPIVSRFTVFFENPFWVGLYERESNGAYEACKIIFGAEPKEPEIYAFLLKHWQDLRFSPPLQSDRPPRPTAKNPKRLQRELKKLLRPAGVGTKAQQALKLQQEAGKIQRGRGRKRRREEAEERQFSLRQEKRKKKHQGH